MSPLQIKLAIYALIAIIITGAYFGWAYHQQQIGYEKAAKEVALRDADTARQSAELLATEKAKVEQSNKEQTARLQDAITIYATRTNDLNDDIDNLTKRLRNNRPAASCNQNAVPGTGNNNQERERRNNEADNDIARAAIKLANLCEKKINELKVVN